MKKILVTGGTVFVSRFIAEYYVKKGDEVYVLNRNTRPQSEGVKLICADRHNIGEVLKGIQFDMVIDTAYTGEDVSLLSDALENYDNYILISSSAVYPENCPQPIKEESALAVNKYWGVYGTNKIEAEKILLQREPDAYILRPPYLYGPMNNVYREAFVFECAVSDRKFYLPKDGEMKLQFFHVEDLCRVIDAIWEKKPSNHIFNVGNKTAVTVKEWVSLCYEAAGKQAEFEYVKSDIEQRNYFPFYDYEYYLDVSGQSELIPDTKSLKEGLKEAFEWWKDNSNMVNIKRYTDYIDTKLKREEP